MDYVGIGALRIRQVAAIVGFLFGTAGSDGAAAADLLDALKATSLVDSGKLMLIDLRTPAERAAHGVPKGSIWIEWRGLEQAAAFIQSVKTAQPDTSLSLAFICSVGHRSGQAARLAEREGYRQVFDVAEGVNGGTAGPGWRAWGLPMSAVQN